MWSEFIPADIILRNYDIQYYLIKYKVLKVAIFHFMCVNELIIKLSIIMIFTVQNYKGLTGNECALST